MIVSFSNLDLAQVRLRLPPLKDKQQEMTLWEFISPQKSVSASLHDVARSGAGLAKDMTWRHGKGFGSEVRAHTQMIKKGKAQNPKRST